MNDLEQLIDIVRDVIGNAQFDEYGLIFSERELVEFADRLRQQGEGMVLVPVVECPRISLVNALYGLASNFENTLGAFGNDAEALRKAQGDIAFARNVAEQHNDNGVCCPLDRGKAMKPRTGPV